ncbi:hypothetical protein MERGE_000005 [Pneumocystis wakefieldiae]|uniref:Guided entry of tail-anchored proteins 1 n=1 Tax=Pneumocystis wakefieldiae TaxID=38082 RepID=A0A899GAX1_9ASCO|nr:hypothetical protein MERGE_000005 [Pneumocystis wakefieldiae]
MSLLFVCFVIVVVINSISFLGVDVISSLIFTLYSNFFPYQLSSIIKRYRLLQRSALQTKKELSNTSSVDEFAKWAKLRRKYDKEISELEKSTAEMNNQRYYFNVKMRIIIWLCTYGLQYIIQWYYRKIPVFWLAKGWFPRYIEWILCFPMAPIGSVSVSIWFFVVNHVVSETFCIIKNCFFENQVKRDINSEIHSNIISEKKES